ncbi:MAG: hypothetical protein ACLR56_04075 [Oscillospiraceae bacterium]
MHVQMSEIHMLYPCAPLFAVNWVIFCSLWLSPETVNGSSDEHNS